MAKVMKFFLFVSIYTLFFSKAYSQTPRLANLDLQSNDAINDVKYNEFTERYYIGGLFTSIGGVNAQNFAELNDSLSVQNTPFVNGLNGSVETIATDSSYLVIGGNFSMINGENRNGLAIFSINSSKQLVLNSINSITSPNAIVSDIEITESHIIIVGQFQFMANGVEKKNIIVLNKSDLSFSEQLFQNVQIDSYDSKTLKIFKTSSLYVITGDHVKKGNNAESSGVKFDHSGNYVGEIAVVDDVNKFGREIVQVKDNLFSYSRKPSNTTEIVMTDIGGNVMYQRSPNPSTAQSSCYGNQLPDKDQEIYNDEIFYIQDYSPSTTVIERYGVEVADSINHIVDFTSMWCKPVSNDQGGSSSTRKLIAANNKLFYHDKRLKKIEGGEINNKGLVAFCLEPYRPTSIFKKAKPNPCEKVPAVFEIDAVKNASGYEWSYTGTGAKIRLASDTTSPFLPLSSGTVFNSKTANEVQIEFDYGFTDGEVIVKPFTVCNSIIDRLYSREVRTPIQNNTSTLIYNVSQTTDVYNCQVDEVQLTATTNFPVEEYYWKLDAPSAEPQYGQTVTFNVSEYNTTIYDYKLEIRYNGQGQTQCVKTQTVRVTLDKQVPNLAIASDFVYFNCNNTSLDLLGTSDNSSDILSWNVNGASYQNPVHIDTTQFSSATLYLKGQHPTSFCVDSIPVVIDSDFSIPSAPLINGNAYSQLDAVAELSCLISSFEVNASNNLDQNSTFYWLDEALNQIQTCTLTLNKLTDIVHVVGPNGCENSFSVFANTDLTLPLVSPMADTVINCSVDTILLMHPSVANISNGWIGTNGLDMIQVSDTGNYVFEIINELNGCNTFDTVHVTSSPLILIDVQSPTFVCDGQAFEIEANAVGITNPTIVWNATMVDSIFRGFGNEDTLLIVTVSDPTGCYGTDTIVPNVAPVITNEVEMFLSCDEEFIFMNNVVVAGGIAPFLYSIDGVNFSENNTIDGLLPGNYYVFIKDGSNCTYSYPVSINEGVPPPNLHFLASTYNQTDDFVALVNTTSFGGFDTVYWQLPSGIQFEHETDTVRYISALDTGFFDITLIGMIDTCMYTFVKSVYFGALDSIEFNLDKPNGIQNLNLSPNPTSGQFNVDVTFGVEQNYYLYITDMAGNIIANSLKGFGIQHSESFDITSQPAGTYILRVISDFDSAYFPFVKSE